jgi:hypothetical protein
LNGGGEGRIQSQLLLGSGSFDMLELHDRETIKIVISSRFGSFFSCSDYDVYDALEDYINENYDFSVSVKHLETETEIYFSPIQTEETLNEILKSFFENFKGF